MPLIEVDEADKQAVIDAFAAHMQKRRERICIAIEQAGGVPVTALQALLEVPARLGGRALRRRDEHGENALRRLRAGQGVAAVTNFQ